MVTRLWEQAQYFPDMGAPEYQVAQLPGEVFDTRVKTDFCLVDSSLSD
jgi:hypothetical protein